MSLLAIPALLATRALGDLTPTAPGPNQTFAAGSNCTLSWNADTNGTWKNVTINLMSGSNDNMSVVTNVASGLDGTNASLSPYSWTCPEVDPYSDIYFYQFTNGDDLANSKWTTRFTITSPSNVSVPPEYSQQPNGDPIPWGIGVLAPPNSTDSEAKFANANASSIAASPSSTNQPGGPTPTSTSNSTGSSADSDAGVTNVSPAIANVGSGKNKGGDGNSDASGTGGGSNDDDDSGSGSGSDSRKDRHHDGHDSEKDSPDEGDSGADLDSSSGSDRASGAKSKFDNPNSDDQSESDTNSSGSGGDTDSDSGDDSGSGSDGDSSSDSSSGSGSDGNGDSDSDSDDNSGSDDRSTSASMLVTASRIRKTNSATSQTASGDLAPTVNLPSGHDKAAKTASGSGATTVTATPTGSSAASPSSTTPNLGGVRGAKMASGDASQADVLGGLVWMYAGFVSVLLVL